MCQSYNHINNTLHYHHVLLYQQHTSTKRNDILTIPSARTHRTNWRATNNDKAACSTASSLRRLYVICTIIKYPHSQHRSICRCPVCAWMGAFMSDGTDMGLISDSHDQMVSAAVLRSTTTDYSPANAASYYKVYGIRVPALLLKGIVPHTLHTCLCCSIQTMRIVTRHLLCQQASAISSTKDSADPGHRWSPVDQSSAVQQSTYMRLFVVDTNIVR